MKTLKIIIAIILLLFFTSINTFAQWQQLNSNVNADLKSVFFIDENIGYAAGGSVILKTTDGGQNWTSYSLNGNLNAVFFTSADTGYVAGFGIYKTTDGGQSWNNLSLPPNSNYFNSIYFTNSQTGYAAGGDFTPVLKTIDAGIVWEELPTISTVFPITLSYTYINSIHFPNENTGYIAGGLSGIAGVNGVLIKTTNSGNSWHTKMGVGSPDGSFNPLMDIGAVFFTDSMKGWIAGSEIFHTNDGGTTWDTVNYPLNNGIHDVFFVNEFIGFTAQNNGDIYFTRNAGQSWINENAPSDNNSMNDIYCVGGVCYAVGDNGTVLKRNVLINSIDEKQTPMFNIYPNPSSGNINISVSENEKNNISAFVTVADIFGKEVFKSKLSGTSTYDFSLFPKGVYFIHFQKGEATQTSKIIIQ